MLFTVCYFGVSFGVLFCFVFLNSPGTGPALERVASPPEGVSGEMGRSALRPGSRVLGAGNGQSHDPGGTHAPVPAPALHSPPPPGAQRMTIPETEQSHWPPHPAQENGQVFQAQAAPAQPGTEVGYDRCAGSPSPPRAGPSNSRERRQLPGLAQASGQSGHVLWAEAALFQPEGRGQRIEAEACQGCCPASSRSPGPVGGPH